jgi:hypothetical protein
MQKEPIKIPLDEFVLELEPTLEVHPEGGFLWLAKTKVVFPSGDILSTGFRYDSGKRWIIDPLVQKTRKYVQPDEETFLRLASHDYIAVVSGRVNELLKSGDLKLRYNGQEGTLNDYRRHCLEVTLEQGNLGDK